TRRRTPKGTALGELDGLKVVRENRLSQSSSQLRHRPCGQKQSVTPQPSRQTRRRRGSADEGACDLAQRGSGLQGCGDRPQQLGTLQVIGGGEGLSGEGTPAGQAIEARHDASSGRIRSVVSEAISATAALVLWAHRPGAEGRPKQLHALDGGTWPVHTPNPTTRRASLIVVDLRGKSAPYSRSLFARGHRRA